MDQAQEMRIYAVLSTIASFLTSNHTLDRIGLLVLAAVWLVASSRSSARAERERSGADLRDT
jgi:hypothetical protein